MSTSHKKSSLIAGKHAVTEALEASVPIEHIDVNDKSVDNRRINDILKSAEMASVSVRKLPDQEFNKLYKDLNCPHQGIVAVMPEFNYASLEEIITNSQRTDVQKKAVLVVVCDHITDAGNLGAIIRSAESAGASGIIIPSKRSAQVNAATYKTSAGAVAHIPIARVPNITRAISQLKDAGFWVVGASEHSQNLVWESDLSGRIALVVGNEHSGISELVLKNCDMQCFLPQIGQIESLNVAQASTVFFYEWLRQNFETVKGS